MKTFKSLLAALVAAFALSATALSGPAMAGVDNTGNDPDPGPISVSGQLAKYVNFTLDRTIINMRDFGGPTYTGNFESSVISGNPIDNAEVIFDANTHISVNILNGDQFTSTKTGVHQDDLLPTAFRIGVKGKSVRAGSLSGAVVATSNAAYADQGFTPASTDTTQVSSTYVFGNGAGSGIRVGARALRSGTDDHYGTYGTANTIITWLDLN